MAKRRSGVRRGRINGPETVMVRGRVAAALVEGAKRRTDIAGDAELVQAPLATLAAVDAYGAWLVAQRGTVDAGLDLGV